MVLTLVVVALVVSAAADQVLAAAALVGRGGEPRRGGAITRCKNTYIEVINIWVLITTTVERINFKCKHLGSLTCCSIRLNIVILFYFFLFSAPLTFFS